MIKSQNISWPIIGHDKVISLLERSFHADQLSHAYLFSGPSSVGKWTTAEYLARLLTCTEKVGLIPCEKCDSCRQSIKGSHSDIIKVSREEEQKISIEKIRNLRSRLSFRPFISKKKIAIIKDVEHLTAAASNALLKTLEEPTSDTIIILTCNDVDRVLLTIRSRCTTLLFYQVPSSIIAEGLMKEGADKKIANSISLISQGRPGQAINYFKEQSTIDEYYEQLHLFLELKRGSIVDRYTRINELLPKGGQNHSARTTLEALFLQWQQLLRKTLLQSYKVDNDRSGREKQFVDQLKIAYSPYELIALIKKLSTMISMLRNNVQPYILAESVILHI
ncbi:ATP-binding protein [Patescibacteria group bacterium]